MIKKADIVLFIILIVFGIAVSILSLSSSKGDLVEVIYDGKTYGTYSLAQDASVTVEIDGHTNVISIEGGKASMAFSSCKNQVCVHTRRISKSGEVIACLPNKILVKIISEKKDGGDVDVISG